MYIERDCKECGTAIRAYTSTQNKCRSCITKTSKPIAKRGKEAKRWDLFRDKVAKPYLDKKFGHVCAAPGCSKSDGLEVDHIKTRGARHDLKYDVNNLQYLCWAHHREKTDGKEFHVNY